MIKKLIISLILVLGIKQVIWIAFIPAWQFPDEQAHFAQVQNIAESGSTKLFLGPTTSKEIIEAERLLGTKRNELGNNQFTYHPEFILPVTTDEAAKTVMQLKNLPLASRTEKVINEATGYPPLYYVLAAFLYRVGYQEDIILRIFLTRMVNIPLFLVSLFIMYRSAKIIFENNTFLIWTAVLLMGFHPMYSFVSAGTTSDNLYNLLSTTFVYLGLVVIKKGIDIRQLIYACVVGVLLWLTKPQAKLLYFIFFPAVFLSSVSNKFSTKHKLVVLLAIAIGGVGYAVLNYFKGVQFLPDIPSRDALQTTQLSIISHLKWSLTHTYREVMPWYWGVYRWLSLTYPRLVHRTINWIMVIAGLGMLTIIFHKNAANIKLKKSVYFLISANVIYFVGLFVFDYMFTRAHNFSFGIQGRYYFPLMSTQMLLVLLGLISFFPSSFKNLVALGAGIAMILLHTYAQWFVSLSYLRPTSVESFFAQASLYKPEFLQGYVLYLISFLYVASILAGVWYYVKVYFMYKYEKNPT